MVTVNVHAKMLAPQLPARRRTVLPWKTVSSLARHLLCSMAILLLYPAPAPAQTISVDVSMSNQTFEGWGRVVDQWQDESGANNEHWTLTLTN